MDRKKDGAFCLWIFFVLLCCLCIVWQYFLIPMSIAMSLGMDNIVDYFFPDGQTPDFLDIRPTPFNINTDPEAMLILASVYIPPPEYDPDRKTLALLYPSGLMGGYRNQAMRFIGLLKHAHDNGYDQLLLPTLVWSTRYANMQYTNLAERLEINKDVPTWPIPFEELFDVHHWNSFHQRLHKKLGPNRKVASSHLFSLPLLITGSEERWEDYPPPNSTVCWKRKTDPSIVSVAAIQNNHPNFTRSFLPLLTQRMLFATKDGFPANKDGHKSHNNFILDPIQNDTIEYLVGDKLAKYPHKLDLSVNVENCTHPYVFGGKSRVLWNSFLAIGKLARKNKKNERESDQAYIYNRLIQTVDKALVPAKPWRQLADHCVEHHLGLGEDEFIQEEEDPHARGHDHGYIALHARVEPEMLQHKCGKDMNRNLETILDLVDLLAQDYNLGHLPEGSKDRAKKLNYESPISDDLRKYLAIHKEDVRVLKGTFVAVARNELNDSGSFQKLVNITKKNRDVLNDRSISYDEYGDELYTTSLAEKDQRKQQRNQALSEASGAAVALEERRRLTAVGNNGTLPVFECGEGWVNHAFYKSEARQKKLFTPTTTRDKNIDFSNLYYKYGPKPYDLDDDPAFPLLPLPDNYFGDLLPSMLNFWLAVRADVFVGVQKSSWSNDVWTTRYYMGKGERNFEYTKKNGILAIGNGGLPPPHKNC